MPDPDRAPVFNIVFSSVTKVWRFEHPLNAYSAISIPDASKDSIFIFSKARIPTYSVFE